MRYRRFGRTDLQVSVFSLGTMRYRSAEDAIATVQRAVELGINHLETARGYGDSELYLGQALKTLGVPRKDLILTTKLPPISDPQVMSHRIEESLERLGVDYVDCLAIHGLNTWEHLESVTGPGGCWPAIAQAVDQGKVRHVGFSTHGSRELILAAMTTDQFAFVNLHYYLFFQRHAPAIALAHEKDMGVFIISPADKGGRLYTPSETLQTLCQPFTPLALNYRFLLGDRRITTLSLGAANPSELFPALEVADQDGPLSELEQTVLTRLQQQAQTTLATDYCRQCYDCLPCPENIHIPEILRLRNLAIAYDLKDFSQYRYQMFENAGHWFPGMKGDRCTDCGDCLPRCPEHLNIPQLLQDAHERLRGKPQRRLWD